MTTKLRPPRLYRVILAADDIERDAAFYAGLFGQPGIRVARGRHYFDYGGTVLALHDPRVGGDGAPIGPGWGPLCFAVPDLDAVFARAEQLGGLFTERGEEDLPMGIIARRPVGERSFYMRDPSGNPRCFVDDATLFTF